MTISAVRIPGSTVAAAHVLGDAGAFLAPCGIELEALDLELGEPFALSRHSLVAPAGNAVLKSVEYRIW